MSELTTLYLYALYALLLASAASAVWLRSVLASVVATGVFGAALVGVLLFWSAPDVAMAQAAIGSGLVTAFFVVTIHRCERGRR